MKKTFLPVVLVCLAVLRASAAENAGGAFYSQLMRELNAAPLVPEITIMAPDRYWVTVKARDKYERTRLLEAGFDIVEIGKDSVSGAAGAEMIELLSAKAYTILARAPLGGYVLPNKDFPSADAVYHNYKETYENLARLAAAHPGITSLFSIGKTVEGREIWCLRVNSDAKGARASSKPGAFFLGNVHAREHLANEVPLLLAAWLLEHKDDADIKQYLATLDIYIIPMGNPDGAEYDIADGSYRYYRKNMAKNPGGAKGVDLNRNFGAWWCESGSSHNPAADTYCGPGAFSEPESRAIKQFIESRRNLRTHISYHSYGGMVLYPWGGKDEDVTDEKDRRAFVKHAAEMGRLTGYQPYKSSELYVASGDSCDWAYAATGLLSFTFELEGRGFYPGAGILAPAVERNIRAAVYLLSVTADPYRAI